MQHLGHEECSRHVCLPSRGISPVELMRAMLAAIEQQNARLMPIGMQIIGRRFEDAAR
jgi:Asp-tRNA(Asn)/Glu-tRNA(Gln) amidotransferase A subunit family amidase